jgi:hypothetical protein
MIPISLNASLKAKRRGSLRLAILLGCLILACLSCHGTGGNERMRPATDGARVTNENPLASAPAQRNASAVASSPFTPSLEMKENVDFLLTPALVVQQAVSGDGPIIYPSE